MARMVNGLPDPHHFALSRFFLRVVNQPQTEANRARDNVVRATLRFFHTPPPIALGWHEAGTTLFVETSRPTGTEIWRGVEVSGDAIGCAY